MVGGIKCYRIGDRNWIAGQLPARRVETLCKQSALAHEKQIAGRRIGRRRLGCNQPPGFSRIERRKIDPLVCSPGKKQQVTAVGQELRITSELI